MNKLVIRKMSIFLLEKDRHKHLKKIVLCLSLIVAFMTCCILMRPAFTMEKNTVCGIEEHSHTQECYQSRLSCGQEERQAVLGKEETVLICEKVTHEHTQECQDEKGQIICGYDAHIHEMECYLTTYPQAIEGHTHTDACYTQELVCQKTEHIHTDVCYPQQSEGSDPGTNDDLSEESGSEINECLSEDSGSEINDDLSEDSGSDTNDDLSEASDPEINDDLSEESDPEINDDLSEESDSDTNDDLSEESDPEINDDLAEESDSEINDDLAEESDSEINDDLSEESDSEINDDLAEESDPEINDDLSEESDSDTNDDLSEDSETDGLDETEWKSDSESEVVTEPETDIDAKEEQLVLEITDTSVNEETGWIQIKVSYRLGHDCQNPIETRLYVENQKNMNFPQFENYRFTDEDGHLFELVHKTEEQYYIQHQLLPGETFCQTFEFGVSELKAGESADFMVYASAVGDVLPENSHVDQEKYSLTYIETQSDAADSEINEDLSEDSGSEINENPSEDSDSEINENPSEDSDSEINKNPSEDSDSEINENPSEDSDSESETEIEPETDIDVKEDQLVLEITDTSVNEETGLIQVEVSYHLGHDCQNPIETRLYVENQKNMNFPQFENYRFTDEDGHLFKLVHKTEEQYYIRHQLQPGETFCQTFELGVSELKAGESADFVIYASAVGDVLPENSHVDQKKYSLTYTETNADLTSILDLQPGESITFQASFGGARTLYEVTIRKGTQHGYGKLSDTTNNPYSTFEYIVNVPALGIVDEVAFCVQPQKPGPGDGTYTLNSVGSDLLAKICYYTKDSNWKKSDFFSLESTQHSMTYTTDEIFVLGHITAAKIWGDPDWSYRTNTTAQAAAQRLIDYCQDMPDMSFSKSTLDVVGYYKTETGEWRQKTESVTFYADNIVTNGQVYKQTYKMTLPEGIQLHVVGTDTVQTGEVEIDGGTTFYLSAPLELSKENQHYTSPEVEVTHLKGLESYEIVTTAQTQTLALVFGDAEKQTYKINFSVDWDTDISAAVQFAGIKELTGRALRQGEFQFALYEVKDGSETLLEQVQNAADGTFSFGKICYKTLADIGTHTYKIVEVKDNTRNEIQYDDTIYEIAVEIVLDQEQSNQFIAQTTITKKNPNGKEAIVAEEVKFQNQYHATGQVEIGAAEKTLKNSPLVENEFAFVLKDEKGQILQTRRNNASGTAAFDVISYTEQDIGKVFLYTVSEQNEQLKGIAYDPTVYTIKVLVEDSAEGDGNLCITKKIIKGTADTEDVENAPSVDRMTFENTFEGAITLHKVGENEEPLAGAEFKLYMETAEKEWILYSDMSNESEIYQTDNDGKIALTQLPAGNYYFVETKAPEGYLIETDSNGESKKYEFAVGPEGENSGSAENAKADQELTVKNELLRANVKILKVDAADSNKKLAGVIFQLKKEQEAVWIEGMTDKNGEFEITEAQKESGILFEDLSDGTYTLREISAPSGYIIAVSDVVFTVKNGKVTLTAGDAEKIENADTNVIEIHVKNTAGMALPSTGGMGTEVFTIAGMVLLLSAAAWIFLRKADLFL